MPPWPSLRRTWYSPTVLPVRSRGTSPGPKAGLVEEVLSMTRHPAAQGTRRHPDGGRGPRGPGFILAHLGGVCQWKWEDRGERTEDRGQRTEDKIQRTVLSLLSSVFSPLSSGSQSPTIRATSSW